MKGVKAGQSRQDLFKEDLDITAKGSTLCAGDSVCLELNTQADLESDRSETGMHERAADRRYCASLCPCVSGNHCPDVTSYCQLPHQEP